METCTRITVETEQEVPTEAFDSCLRFAVSVLRCMDEEEDELPDSLRMGLDRFAAGGGFNLSATAVEAVVPSGFFTFGGPE